MNGIKMLDLFCCEGVGAMGYDACPAIEEITGMDLFLSNGLYHWEFIRGDALKCDYEMLIKYDFIHASPPCQGYSKRTPENRRKDHPRLIAQTHTMLYASGKPYVIENVEGSGQELRPNLVLSGVDVGLPMIRKRYFHVSNLRVSQERFKAICAQKFNKIEGPMISPNGSIYVSKRALYNAYGMDEMPASNIKWVTKYGMEQGIPPRMTLAIANILFGVW